MKTRIVVTVGLAVLFTISTFAADLGKYSEWLKSPAAYFMTKADRAAWSKLQSESEAERFVSNFIASRGGPAFESEVAAATKAADDHLTVNGFLGSRTLRGRIVILLGPPASFSIAEKQARDHSLTPGGAVNGGASTGGGGRFGTGGGAVGLSASDIVDAANASAMTTRTVQVYTFIYPKDKLPNRPSKDLTINIEVNPATGDDRITDMRMSREVDETLEAAIEARAAAKAAH